MTNSSDTVQTLLKHALLRERITVNDTFYEDNTVTINNHRHINFSSNDYLGIRQHPKVKQAYLNAVKQYGFGSGASALISGYHDSHYELEQQIARWLNVDSALLFSSGYSANLGAISSLINRREIIMADKLCHVSLLQGIQLSRAKHIRFKHNDIQQLAALCTKESPDCFITEGVFSMEGDITPIRDLIVLKHQHQAKLIIDDSHGIGWLGENGAGICAQHQVNQNDFTCITASLGKAFNGAGGIVAGRKEVIHTIIQQAKSYGYTTALPPALCKALSASLNIIINEAWRRNQLIDNINYFNQYAIEKKLQLVSRATTPIKAIIIGDNLRCMALKEELTTQGFYVAAIRPPTVPNDTARLRISLNCYHTKEQITQLIDLITYYMKPNNERK